MTNLHVGHSYHNGVWDAQTVVLVVCSAISIYNAVELLLWIAVTFKKTGGLYFWSLLAASVGLLPYNVGMIMQFFKLAPQAAGKGVDAVGWILIITGQALVLYSRLGLIFQHPKMLRAILAMIIINAIVWHPTTEVLNFCVTLGPNRHTCVDGYRVIEKVQMSFFCLQEFIISGLYIAQTIKLLKVIAKENTRKVMLELLGINLFIIIMDVGILLIEYIDLNILEQTSKTFVYSVKLKLEFLILGKLVDLVKSSNHSLSKGFETHGIDFAVDEHSEADRQRRDVRMPVWLRDLERKCSDKGDTVPTITNTRDPFSEKPIWRTGSAESLTINSPSMSELQRQRTAGSDYARALREVNSHNS